MLLMLSAGPHLAANVGNGMLPLSAPLEGWQRFLQSPPLSPAPRWEGSAETVEETAPAAASANVLEPIAATLFGFTDNWLTGLAVVTGITSSIALVGMTQLATLPPEPDCTELGVGGSTREQLTCLQTAIATGDHAARAYGLHWVGSWPPTEPLLAEGQDLLAQWSTSVLQEAQRAQTEEDWAQAIALAAQVPSTSPHFEAAQTLLGHLREPQTALAATLNEAAQAALQNYDWATAYQVLWQLQALDHPAAPLTLPDALARQIEAERDAVRLWNQARYTWARGTPTDQAAAIALASHISPHTYHWQTVQPVVKRWSDERLPLVPARRHQGDWAAAIAIAPPIAQNPGRADHPVHRLWPEQHCQPQFSQV